MKRNKKRRRIGRGAGSGQGKTAGKGHKGQRSRAGWSRKPTFQGGRCPWYAEFPNGVSIIRSPIWWSSINLSDLEKNFQAGEEVTPETLQPRNWPAHGGTY